MNVNFPPNPTGMCWTRVSVRHYDGRVATTNDPYGREVYWLAVRPIEETEREYGVSDSIKLASNENALGSSPLSSGR